MSIRYFLVKLSIVIVLFNAILLPASAAPAASSQRNLFADKLIYNKPKDIITAKGHVKLYYSGNQATCDMVQYNKRTNTIFAIGNVTIIDKNGNIIHSQKADLTRDLSSGFIDGLEAQTTEKTYFTANNAQRIANGRITIFNNASYTACKSCDEKQSNKPVLWRIKAKQIIWSKSEKQLQFKKSHFDIFGKNLINLPDFSIPDYSVKRYSGFMAPTISYNKYLGYSFIGSYFFNLNPAYDLTLHLGGYSKQGLIASGRWRHRLQNGIYDLSFAYIKQQNPAIFLSNSIDSKKNNRLMLGSKATYKINDNWKIGWDLLLQSDDDFARSYNIDGYNDYVHSSNLYLEGLGRYNYFNLSFYHFNVQDPYLYFEKRHNKNKYTLLQPWILPQITYNYRAPNPLYGGAIKLNTNMRTIYRTDTDYTLFPNMSNGRLSGLKGLNSRLTSELSWEKLIVNKSGLLLRPLLALRVDARSLYSKQQADYVPIRSQEVHGLATAGLELRYPILITNKYAVQTLEPIVQIYLRNNIANAASFPNEDAQDLTFSARSLFQRDKFSGYDRIEYGSRANLGIRYYANIKNAIDVYALAGQSIQLSNKSPFLGDNITNPGQGSGLDHERSDYVSMLQLRNQTGLSLNFRERFNYKNFAIQRNEIDVNKDWSRFSAGVHYTHLAKRDAYTDTLSRSQLASIENLKVTDKWQIGAYQNLDLTTKRLISIGSVLTYQNDCLSATLLYSQNKGLDKMLPNQSFGFRLNLRTIMELHNN